MDYINEIKAYIERETSVLKALDTGAVNAAMNLLAETIAGKKNAFIFGNGGSAAAASQFANDFNKGLYECTDMKPRFISLSENVAALTAIASDIGYDEVFHFQLRARISPGDLVIAISVSGNSANVIKAAEYAKMRENKVIGLTGYSGGKLRELADVSLHAPVDSKQITEDIHTIFGHLMMSVFCAASR